MIKVLDSDIRFFYLTRALVFVFLVLLATLISSSFSLDSLAYQDIFSTYSKTGWSEIFSEIKQYELFFLFSAKVFNGLPSVFWFGFIAFLSILLKLTLVQKGSRNFYLSLFFYVAYFFVLQDGTGIRVSLAIALAFWGAFCLSKDRFFWAFFLFSIAALFFHYSLFLFFIVFFFRDRRVSYFFVFLWPFLIILWWFGFDLISVIRSVVIDLDLNVIGLNKFRYYALNVSASSAPYSLQFLILYIASVLVFLRFKDELKSFELICFNCVFVSMVFLGVFVGAEGLQNRVSEIFRFGLVFIFPFYYQFCLEATRNRMLTNVLVFGGLIGYFYYYVLRAGLIVWPENGSLY